MKQHRKMLITICVLPLLAFICGLLGSCGAFGWEIFMPIAGISVLIVFLVTFIRLIISIIKKHKIRECFVTTLLALLLYFVFTFQGKLAFYGAVIHYKLMNSHNYSAIRHWGESLPVEEITENFYLLKSRDVLPDCVEIFNPVAVYVLNKNNHRIVILNWTSGLMAYDLRLTIAPKDMEQGEIDFRKKTFYIAKIRNGVYLSRSTD